MFLERVETSDVRSSRQEISCGGYYNDIAVVVVVVVFVGCPRARRFTRERLSRAMDSRVGSAELARVSFQARESNEEVSRCSRNSAFLSWLEDPPAVRIDVTFHARFSLPASPRAANTRYEQQRYPLRLLRPRITFRGIMERSERVTAPTAYNARRRASRFQP